MEGDNQVLLAKVVTRANGDALVASDGWKFEVWGLVARFQCHWSSRPALPAKWHSTIKDTVESGEWRVKAERNPGCPAGVSVRVLKSPGNGNGGGRICQLQQARMSVVPCP